VSIERNAPPSSYSQQVFFSKSRGIAPDTSRSHVPGKIDNENIIEDFENFMITRQVRKLKWL
jgi:hypothetical protein